MPASRPTPLNDPGHGAKIGTGENYQGHFSKNPVPVREFLSREPANAIVFSKEIGAMNYVAPKRNCQNKDIRCSISRKAQFIWISGHFVLLVHSIPVHQAGFDPLAAA